MEGQFDCYSIDVKKEIKFTNLIKQKKNIRNKNRVRKQSHPISEKLYIRVLYNLGPLEVTVKFIDLTRAFRRDSNVVADVNIAFPEFLIYLVTMAMRACVCATDSAEKFNLH